VPASIARIAVLDLHLARHEQGANLHVRRRLLLAHLFNRGARACGDAEPSAQPQACARITDAGRKVLAASAFNLTRLVCVEGWSMIGKWTGVPFRTFLQRIGADLTAKYVGFECADGYYSSIDMASALHPQTFLTFKISDEILAPRYGYPLKLRIPTKLGFKNPKWITAIFVTNRFPGGFWEDRGYNWFAGV
jgi:Oxidoreductase molybdopterin binding domain